MFYSVAEPHADIYVPARANAAEVPLRAEILSIEGENGERVQIWLE